MKVINALSGGEIAIDDLLALYTGSTPHELEQRRYGAAEFEEELLEDIYTRDLVLHELNLLQNGFDFWAKIDDGRPEGPGWLPVRMEW